MAKETLKFLGLGTIVEVEDLIALKDIKYFVVVARAIGRDKDDSTLLRYMLAPHPYGDIPDQKDNILRITASQIKKVIHEGYTDELDNKLLDDLENEMRGTLAQVNSNSKTASEEPKKTDEAAKAVAPLVKKEIKNDAESQKIKEQKMLKKDPFYKFRKIKEEKANGKGN